MRSARTTVVAREFNVNHSADGQYNENHLHLVESSPRIGVVVRITANEIVGIIMPKKIVVKL